MEYEEMLILSLKILAGIAVYIGAVLVICTKLTGKVAGARAARFCANTITEARERAEE